ncbi:MAG: phosphatase PAP2 family protein [Spirosomataceae bacterium]
MKKLLCILLLYSAYGYGQQADTVTSKKVTFKTFVVPATLMAGGLLTQGVISRSVRDELVKSYPTFHTSLDNSMQYAPLALLAGFDAIGLKAKHNVGDQVILALLSNGLAQSITQGLKYTVRYPRPDGEGNESFPSGHTTMAFTSATLLHQEFGQQSVVISILGYSAATATGAMRMLNNRHWLADVLFGAGVGIGSTKVVYALYPWIQRKIFKRTNVVALPTYSGSSGGFYVAVVF